MIGAIAGDIIGSVYEHHNIKKTEFPLFSSHCRFTDDSVLTVAVADSILRGIDYAQNLKAFCRRYPNAGYGGTFIMWAHSESTDKGFPRLFSGIPIADVIIIPHLIDLVDYPYAADRPPR